MPLSEQQEQGTNQFHLIHLLVLLFWGLCNQDLHFLFPEVLTYFMRPPSPVTRKISLVTKGVVGQAQSLN
jgi:hypothetical protein